MNSVVTLHQLTSGVSTTDAATLFDSLPAVAVPDVVGATWHGGEVPTDHPMDGLLTISGWYGKRFDDADRVHPLLFGERGSLFPVNPKLVPIGLLNTLGPKLPKRKVPGLSTGIKAAKTRRHRARLRVVEFQAGDGPAKPSAAMVYDDLPIIDHFRWLDTDILLGAMDLRGSAHPYFFYLERD
ncbi:DUF4334 domain-containing protein [Gordonia sp. CPCC 205333]|uniref:DUF4334 domain-containing protein n=1 Tax=Gordonia sp. CPCC 205333 TaxID=3140790 RepID=UPI003AF39463